MMIYGIKGGAELSLIPSPSLIIVCKEACGMLHVGKKKYFQVSPLFAHIYNYAD